MADKGDLDVSKGQSIIPQDELPYKFGGKYTAEELEKLRTFMNAHFPHLNYGTGRDKGIIVEYPPQEICAPEDQKYRNLLDEKIANRRALRAIRRMWPDARWGNPDNVYEEDK